MCILNNKKFWRVLWFVVIAKVMIDLTCFYSQAATTYTVEDGMIASAVEGLSGVLDINETNDRINVCIKSIGEGTNLAKVLVTIDGEEFCVGFVDQEESLSMINAVLGEPIFCGIANEIAKQSF